MAITTWKLNGVPLPLNPASVEWPMVKSNSYYEIMIDGNYRRLVLPNKFSGRTVKLTWKSIDARARAALWSALASQSQNVVQLTGTQPLLQLNLYFDDMPKDAISDQVIDPRLGQGGIRRDIEIDGQSEPFFRSVNLIPSTLPSQASVASWFGGPLGNAVLDGIPVWNGAAWNTALNTTPGSVTVGQNVTMTNMGTAPWSPIIKINGPFSTFALNVAYTDVDGTNQGVTFTWTGATLGAGSYLIFDTKNTRVWTVIGGVKTEVYTFTLTLPGSSNTPFAFFPIIPPAQNFTVSATYASTVAASSSLDYSNGGTEQFRYF